MADFTDAATKIQSVNKAAGLLNAVRSAHTQSKSVQEYMALYQANTDPVFNASVNAMFTAAERAELADMAGDIGTLVAHLEANHASALGIEEQT